jgi:hypothetical protein
MQQLYRCREIIQSREDLQGQGKNKMKKDENEGVIQDMGIDASAFGLRQRPSPLVHSYYARTVRHRQK